LLSWVSQTAFQISFQTNAGVETTTTTPAMATPVPQERVYKTLAAFLQGVPGENVYLSAHPQFFFSAIFNSIVMPLQT